MNCCLCICVFIIFFLQQKNSVQNKLLFFLATFWFYNDCIDIKIKRMCYYESERWCEGVSNIVNSMIKVNILRKLFVFKAKHPSLNLNMIFIVGIWCSMITKNGEFFVKFNWYFQRIVFARIKMNDLDSL